MSTTVGRVDWIAGIDGTLLPSEARRLGNQIGAALGQAASRRASRSFTQGVGSWDVDGAGARLGERLANSLGAAFRGRFQASLGDAGASLRKALDMGPVLDDIGELVVVMERGTDATSDLGAAWRAARTDSMNFNMAGREGVRVVRELEAGSNSAARSTNRLAGAYAAVRNSVSSVNTQLRDSSARFRENISGGRLFGGVMTNIFKKGGDAGRGFGGVIGDLNDKWRSMAHGLRQAIFYVALFATLASDIAVLGSAAGSGLTVLAGAALQGAIGIGVMVAAIVGLTKPLEEIPDAVRPAAAAFQALGDLFSSLGQQITVRAFGGLEDVFSRFGGLIETLTPSILLVADAVGRVVTQLVNMLTSSNGVAVLKTLIEGAAPVFELLASAAFNLGGALGNIFAVAQPYIQGFAGWLNTALTEFNAWTQSLSGQNALKEWFENGKTVFEALVPLLGQVGDFLNKLVTPAAVASLVTFMEIIGGALGPLGAFLSALNSFGLWNILAQLISTVFTALEPLMPLFTALGTTLQTLVLGALQAITPILTMLVTAFAMLAEPIINAVLPAVLALLPMFSQLVVMLMPLVSAVMGLAAQLGQALAPVFLVVVQAVLQLIAALLPLVGAVIPPLVAIITTLTETLMPLISAVLPPLISLFLAVMEAILPIIPIVVELVAAFLSLIAPLLELIGPILPPLTSLLKVLVTGGVDILKAAIQVLTPILMGLANGIKAVLIPAVDGIKGVFSAVGDFLENVFAGRWDRFWSGLLGIVESIASGVMGAIRGLVNGAASIINGIIGGINNLSGAVGIPPIPKIPKWASGGIAWNSMIANIGEAGPEMVVPLRRPLSMVDPAVRDVAAYAQGKGGGERIGVQNNIEEGAIVVIDRSGDSRRTGNEVLQRLVEDLAS